MLNKGIYFIFLFCLFGMTAIAQPEGEMPVEGDDGAKEAQERAKYLMDFHNYNNEINSDLSSKKMFYHHIDVNRNNASIPNAGVITQAIDCYFIERDGEFVIKKILVLTNEGAVSSTKEFVFDYRKNGELSYYAFNSNINKAGSETMSVYFDNQQLMYYAEDGLVQPKNSYGDEVFKKGIEVLNLSADYELMLNTLIRVQPK